MTDISRRSMLVGVAGAGGAVLAGTLPSIAEVANGDGFGVRAICVGWDWEKTLAHCYCLERQGADGAWAPFRGVYSRLVRMPDSVVRDKQKRHVASHQRVTFFGPSPFELRADAWEATAIVNWKGERLAFTTALEKSAIVNTRMRQKREREREIARQAMVQSSA